ncbi:MAG: hypothetical protein IJB99_04045, partial [Clostridia bacterium]|nr:hypothetical protein [Clostridia bacterium]
FQAPVVFTWGYGNFQPSSDEEGGSAQTETEGEITEYGLDRRGYGASGFRSLSLSQNLRF